ncbi:MAG: hypothetical protein JSV12_02750 [Candidatus Bathyarchaeota archaeon]|nr:MAG: hypothetical protein JSV12_02750 [Candidatus Bathyarchaeota archaeon]
MKKVLLYVATAILLGTVTMLAPVMLLKSDRYDQMVLVGRSAKHFVIPETKALDRGEGLGRAVSPPNILSAGLILIPSFLLAFGVSLYLKKRVL